MRTRKTIKTKENKKRKIQRKLTKTQRIKGEIHTNLSNFDTFVSGWQPFKFLSPTESMVSKDYETCIYSIYVRFYKGMIAEFPIEKLSKGILWKSCGLCNLIAQSWVKGIAF